MIFLRNSSKGLLIAACILFSPAAMMLLAFSLLEILIGITAAGGAVALFAVLGIGVIVARRLLATPPLETPTL